MQPEPSVSRTAEKSAVDETVLPQVGVTVQFFAAGAVDDAAEQIRCGWCGALFHVHQSCFRGQAYCSDRCRGEGGRRRCAKARDNYRRSIAARDLREDNCERNRAYRARQRSVMDRSSRELDFAVKSAPEAIAGEERRVPRRGFVICAVCGGEGRLIVVGRRRRRARDPP